MIIHCRTNLDLCHCEKWPEELPTLPRVGDRIESAHEWLYYDPPLSHDAEYYTRQPMKSRVELEVVSVSWRASQHLIYKTTPDKYGWIPFIELHLPKGRFENLTAFFEWYGKITGKGKSAFI